jgi:hypothetical protein
MAMECMAGHVWEDDQRWDRQTTFDEGLEACLISDSGD